MLSSNLIIVNDHMVEIKGMLLLLLTCTYTLSQSVTYTYYSLSPVTYRFSGNAYYDYFTLSQFFVDNFIRVPLMPGAL
jgi:hypothetical protein